MVGRSTEPVSAGVQMAARCIRHSKSNVLQVACCIFKMTGVFHGKSLEKVANVMASQSDEHGTSSSLTPPPLFSFLSTQVCAAIDQPPTLLPHSLYSRYIYRKEVNVEKVYPLSLLAFVATAHALSVSRQPPHRSRRQSEEKESVVLRGKGERESPEKDGGSGGRDCSSVRDRVSGGERGKVMSQVTGLEHVFRRHVKPKKQHEIKHLAEVHVYTYCLPRSLIFMHFQQEIVTMVGVTGCKNIIVSNAASLKENTTSSLPQITH